MKPIKHMKVKKEGVEMYLRTDKRKALILYFIHLPFSNRSMNMCVELNTLLQYELYF